MTSTSLQAEVVAALITHRLTIAVAESLTGGQLVATLVDVPGASATVIGGVVAYNTAIKHSILGVDATLLATNGAVDPEVARQMATGVRDALAIDGTPAAVGLATTGVAGPDPQDGKPVGTVFIGLAIADRVQVLPLSLSGSRAEIRSLTVEAALNLLRTELDRTPLE